MTSPPAELRLDRAGEESWTWRYVEGTIELFSNETYDSRDAAVDAARRAYPDLSFAGEEDD